MIVYSLFHFFVFINNIVYISGNKLAKYFVIDGNDRGKTACADTSACIKREFAVLCTFADIDGKSRPEFVEDLIGSFDIAGCSHAYVDLIFSLWIDSKLGIETYNTVNLCERYVELLRDDTLHLERQVSEKFLSLMKYRDKSSAGVFILGDYRVQLFKIF